MHIEPALALSAMTVIASGGVAFGLVKGKMYNYMTYDKHRAICETERKETNEALGKLFEAQKEAHGMIKEIHGYLKGKNGGSL